MSCYFRHLKDIFDEAGIKVTESNKKEIDKVIHKIVNVSYKNCPETWKEIKLGIADAQKRQEFIKKLKNAIPGNS
jgi:ribosomal protein L17